MKRALLCLALGLCLIGRTQADLTIVQKVDGISGTGNEVIVRIKGDKARVDATPQVSTIVDGKTGEIVTLMKDKKTVVRISAEKMKAAAEMIRKFSNKNGSEGPAKPKASGRKETINGYEAEEYTVDTPFFKAAYWLAPSFPDGAAILRQLRAVKSEIWNSASGNAPDYRDFPALPIKTVMDMGKTKVTTTLVSVSQAPLNDADFAIPADFQEMKAPDFGRLLQPDQDKPEASTEGSPHP
jgi:hypothetical protein